MPWVAAIALAAVTGVAVWGLRPPPAPLSRDAVSVTLADGVDLPLEMAVLAALSPDGQHLVYVGESAGTRQLYHRRLDQVDAVPIADTEGASDPFFSPDGEWIGFSAGTVLRKVRLAGGSAVTVCALPGSGSSEYAGGWSDDGTIWFGSMRTGLYQVPDTGGGVPRAVTALDAGNDEVGHYAPHPLPGGRAILYTAARADFSVSVNLYLPETDEHRPLADGQRPWFATSGHVVFSGTELSNPTGEIGSGGTLWVRPFDVDRLQVTGEAVRVREAVHVTPGSDAQAYGAMDGTLVYVPSGRPSDNRTLVWVSRDGTEEPIPAEPRRYTSPRLSPAGTHIAINILGVEGLDIWVLDLLTEGWVQITDRPGLDGPPLWTPGGDRIVFAYGGERPEELWWVAADGSDQAEHLWSDPGRSGLPYWWTADGSTLLVSEFDLTGQTGADIGALTMDQEGVWTRKAVMEQPLNEYTPAASPDGQWLAYVTGAPGSYQLFVSPYPGLEWRTLVSLVTTLLDRTI